MFKLVLVLFTSGILIAANFQDTYAQMNNPNMMQNRQNMMRQGQMMNSQNMMMRHQQMMLQNLGTADPNYDLRYMDIMIMHHQQAVAMAKNALVNARHPELKQFAQNIITNQTQEINQMKAWRKEWYGK